MWEFLENFGNEGSAIGGIIAFVLFVAGILRWLTTRKSLPRVEVANFPAPPPFADDDVKMSSKTFVDLQKRLLEQARVELQQSHGAERQRLEEKIDALNARLADPERALAEQQAIIQSLEEQLARQGNQLGGDATAEARAALEAGDFTKARALFETLAARTDPDVKSHADAAFALGQIAEAELRWHDAHRHYKRAASLTDDLDHLKAQARMTWRLHLTAEGIPLQRKLCDLIKVREGETSAAFATALSNLASFVQQSGDFKPAEHLFRRALAISKATIGTAHPDYASCLNNLAGVMRAQGRYTEAEELYCQALTIVEASIGTSHHNYATHLNNLAGVMQDQGRYAEAEDVFRQALKIGAATIGTAHPNYANSLNNLAVVIREQGRYPEAEDLYRQALKIDEVAIGNAHPDYANDLNNLAGVIREQGRFPEAEDLYHQALAIDKATIGTAHPDYATHLNNLAMVVQAQGRLPEAENLYRQALSIDEATIGTAHPAYAINLNNIAGVVQAQLRLLEAEGLYRQALAILRLSLGDAHPTTIQIANNLLTLLLSHTPNSPDIPALQALIDTPPTPKS